jgi:CRP/FNR family cyclic AMP-dependent transcriptional regulator
MATAVLDHLLQVIGTAAGGVVGAAVARVWALLPRCGSRRRRRFAAVVVTDAPQLHFVDTVVSCMILLCRGSAARGDDRIGVQIMRGAPSSGRNVAYRAGPAAAVLAAARAMNEAALLAGAVWPETSLLGQLREVDRAALTRLGTRASFPAGRTILREGDTGDHIYLLLAGSVKVTGNEAGREPLLAIRLAGDAVGEMSVLDGAPRSATVVSCTPTVVRVIPGVELMAFLARRSNVAVEFAGMLSRRLRWANQRRVHFATLPARARVVSVLVALDEAYGQDGADGRVLSVPLTQEEIASLAGVRLPTAEKALRELQRQGLVRLGYRRLVVVDAASLREGIDG